jgi:hypothetical protein
MNSTYYVDEDVSIEIEEAKDHFNTRMTYVIDWGDGGEMDTWVPGEDAVHRYQLANNYTITVTVMNEYGETQTVSGIVSIIDRPPADDDDDDDDDTKAKEEEGTLGAIIAAIAIIVILVLIGFIFLMVRSKDEDDGYYEEGYEEDVLESAIVGSMEE